VPPDRVGVIAATNALYPQITGRKTSLSMAQKVQAGWWPGPARLGYRNADNPASTSANDRRIIIPHEVIGPLVTQAFALYATGRYSLKSLCAEMEPLGLRSAWGGRVTITSLRKMLGDPFYISRAAYKGEVRSWKHQSLTDVETFQKCRLVLTEETYRRQSAQIAESLEKINLEVARLDLSRESNIGVFEQVMRLATNAEAAYMSAPLALKRTYLTLFFDEIVIQDKKIVSASLTPAFAALLNDHSVYDDNARNGASSEALPNKKSPNIIETGTVLEAVINSEHWLPGPSEFITLFQDVGYWNRVHRIFPLPV